MPKATDFAARVMNFNRSLDFDHPLPAGFEVMNPFQNDSPALAAATAFYEKYYADNRERGIILGINPGRFGAAITGVPFTDPRRLASECGVEAKNLPDAREPSSEFVYRVIDATGGPKAFYSDWYINSVCPLGFAKTKPRKVNANYYDTPALRDAALPFILKTLKIQLELGVKRDFCVCMGTGKNAAFLRKLNEKYKFFGEIFPLEHPRYIIQYKSAEVDSYVAKYVETLRALAPSRPVTSTRTPSSQA